jgi:hypothetical protein
MEADLAAVGGNVYTLPQPCREVLQQRLSTEAFAAEVDAGGGGVPRDHLLSVSHGLLDRGKLLREQRPMLSTRQSGVYVRKTSCA